MPITHSCQTIIRGTLYPSMSAAARALGVSVQAVHDAAEKGRLDGVGLRKAQKRNRTQEANHG